MYLENLFHPRHGLGFELVTKNLLMRGKGQPLCCSLGTKPGANFLIQNMIKRKKILIFYHAMQPWEIMSADVQAVSCRHDVG